MVRRIYVEKKFSMSREADSLRDELVSFLGIPEITGVRIINRYDVENVDGALMDRIVGSVFSEPQVDDVYRELSVREGERVFAVEYLPGQFDQRADSAMQCIRMISPQSAPVVKTAKIYAIGGNISDSQFSAIKKYVINPVDSREAEFGLPQTLTAEYPVPEKIETLCGFSSMNDEKAREFLKKYNLAMDLDDLAVCMDYFRREMREPTLTELKVIDTYWSDHCRHTTFLTNIDSVEIAPPLVAQTYRDYLKTRDELNDAKPVCLMDMATIAAKYLRAKGALDGLDVSDEINACTVKIKVDIDGKEEDYLLLFKNETHNHPTEIEPFGGAATCIGGAIRDPLSGRAYVYAAMRLTGAGNPLTPVKDTARGKLPQRKIVTSAARGYSSYGNQIGIATGMVNELYHSGYTAKRMEIGAVIAAAPVRNVRRESPAPGDAVILLGGRTGRDGCGGATGSSRSHTVNSIETCGAEVQKGNAPEERKLQRLFRNPKASLLIKRCNDFGAGGVAVAIGELADGLCIDLNAVPKKYEGLDGTELAISESQERMAVVVADEDAEAFIALASQENLEATRVASVTADSRLTMMWNGEKIVDISRDFLNSNGAVKHADVRVADLEDIHTEGSGNFTEDITRLASSLGGCSQRGLAEAFDSTIGAGTVLMPFGGKNMLTPIQAMVHKIPVERGDTDTCSVMAWGYNPQISQKDPFRGAYLAVVESVSKLIAVGARFKDVYLSFQEYFPKPMHDPERWGKPFAALLGAFRAQKDLGIAAIGGKDSMSGTFENMDVPPTLVSFAVTTTSIGRIVSGEFKKADRQVRILRTRTDAAGLPETQSLKENFNALSALIEKGKVHACYTPAAGVADAVMKMCIGNGIGFAFADGIDEKALFSHEFGAFIIETDPDVTDGERIGYTQKEGCITLGKERVALERLVSVYEGTLESVYPLKTPDTAEKPEKYVCNERVPTKPRTGSAVPSVLIPVFPGTNCEYDSARAVERAGAHAEIFVIKNRNSSDIDQSVRAFAAKVAESQAIFIPGGFSGGDEPDGSGKFITAFFRNARIADAVHELLGNRDGLMLGICNGFQALIKLGLVPYGKILPAATENCPTLTYNTIGRHQSCIVRTRIASVKSPWLTKLNVGDIISVPISHGEGRFVADSATLHSLAANGQIATQYVDEQGNPSMDIRFNPNGSAAAVEGILSPDGRVLGKMGHSERVGKGLYKNVEGNYDMKLFDSLVEYYR